MLGRDDDQGVRNSSRASSRVVFLFLGGGSRLLGLLGCGVVLLLGRQVETQAAHKVGEEKEAEGFSFGVSSSVAIAVLDEPVGPELEQLQVNHLSANSREKGAELTEM